MGRELLVRLVLPLFYMRLKGSEIHVRKVVGSAIVWIGF